VDATNMLSNFSFKDFKYLLALKLHAAHYNAKTVLFILFKNSTVIQKDTSANLFTSHLHILSQRNKTTVTVSITAQSDESLGHVRH
jgi:hypothetical protein